MVLRALRLGDFRPSAVIFAIFSVLLSSAALVSSADASEWSSAGSMVAARDSHTATLLPNGKVLIAGGENWNGVAEIPLASAELYDPATGNWFPAGTMANPRYSHSAVLLANGKVLVAGGAIEEVELVDTAELYDPATNTWTTLPSIGENRTDLVAGLLPNGQALIAGGGNAPPGSFSTLNSTEFYDPAANAWSDGPTMSFATARGALSTLANGQWPIARERGRRLVVLHCLHRCSNLRPCF